MQRITHTLWMLLVVVTLALGGCDLFGSDGGGGGTDGGDDGGGRASIAWTIDASYA